MKPDQNFLLPEQPSGRLTYHTDGAELFPAVVSQQIINEIIAETDHLTTDRAGKRLYGLEVLRPILSGNGIAGSIVANLQGSKSKPVRAILFDKTPDENWGLRWHQDRTIAVAERIEIPGFGPWTVKDGALHVAPPFEILANMITIRIHLDDVPLSNAPLLIAPRSHHFGRVSEADTVEIVRRCGSYACLAKAGDIWLYATPILHASKVSEVPSRRRVLQVDYAAEDLPGGLNWLGI